MGLARSKTKEWRQRISSKKNSRLAAEKVLLLWCLCLCSLATLCEGFTVPFPLNSNALVETTVSRRRETKLASIRTESPPASTAETIAVGCSPHDVICISTIAKEALTMASGDGAVDTSNDNDDSEINEDGADNENEEESPEREHADDEQIRRRAAAALLRRKQGRVRAVKPLKSTSVGSRRAGSATKARSNQRGTGKILDTVRTVASAAAASKQSESTNTTAKVGTSGSQQQQQQQQQQNSTSTSQVGSNVIQATISSLLEGQNAFKQSDDTAGMSMNALPRPFGILGEEPDPLSHELLKRPMPGTMLLYPTIQTREYRRPSQATLSVRVATPNDDYQIANLRLSVFSDFSSELQSQFCARSCQVLADRRLRGATCLVASCPSGRKSPAEIVVGSVECSVHEFFATKLGQRRPKYSTLYVTEVAVSPSARRCGVGSKLLQGVDELAALRNVESLYLHVDVLNFGALELYRKAGYRKVHHGDPMYAEFTTSLNLHDGATKGRRHYLLYKNLIRNPTWLPAQDEHRSRNISNVDTTTWGFENVLS